MSRRRSLRRLPLSLLAAFALPAACAPVAVTTQVAWARLALGGDLALGTDGSDSAAQDVESAFGLGSVRDCPYVRVAADWGTPRFFASGFWLQESGTGMLTEPFGELPAGTNVASDLQLGNGKLAGALAIPVGPLTIAPGVLFDVFAIDFRASSSPGNREEVDDVVGVPMPFVRCDGPLLGGRAIVEIGYVDPPEFVGVDGRFADVEVLFEWEVGARWQFTGGYRFLSADGEGESATDSIAIDLQVSGWFVGGGIRF